MAEPLASDTIAEACREQLVNAVEFGEAALASRGNNTDLVVVAKELRRRMSRYGAHIRSTTDVAGAVKAAEADYVTLNAPSIDAPQKLPLLHKIRDMVVCQYVYLSAIHDYIENGGGSRGSYLIQNREGEKPHALLPDRYAHRLDDNANNDRIQEVLFKDGECSFFWRKVRPLPPEDEWFESVWRDYSSGKIFQ
jgi:hypothetical protein